MVGQSESDDAFVSGVTVKELIITGQGGQSKIDSKNSYSNFGVKLKRRA